MLATRAASVRHVLIENARNFTNREAYTGLQLLLGDGLLTIDDPEHKQQRRMVMPAFHKQRVESYAERMVQDTLDTLAGWQPGQRLDMALEMQYLTLRIAAKALFNMDLGTESSSLGKAFVKTGEYINRARMISLGNLQIDLPFTAYGKFKRAKALLDGAVYEIIESHRQAEHDYGDMLSMLLQARDEDGSALSDKQIHDQTMTFLAAGHATTANTLSWAFYLLSQHAEVRQKLQEEICAVLGDRPPTAADLEHMPYLERVIKETLRIYPPAWALLRKAREDYDLEGYHLPGGSFVILCQYITHRMPEYWSEPEKFDPDRFAPGRKEPFEDFAYFPFGAGPRTCIGLPFAMLDARLLLATILQKFSPGLIPGSQVNPEPLITLVPKGGLPMVLGKSNG